jgi:N-acetylmuramoyl-L-alanine amidase
MWTPIVNKSFNRSNIKAYVDSVAITAWHPTFVTLHNTDAPSLSQWHGPTPASQRILNLEHYYRDIQKWSAGPHFFVADDLIWAFTPMSVHGVHTPSWNMVSIGIEMVGSYTTEAFDTNVRDNTVELISAINKKLSVPGASLRLHHEDAATTHRDCPGKNVVKEDMISRINLRMSQI